MSVDLIDFPEFTTPESSSPIHFSPLDADTGLRIIDAVERRQYSLSTPTDVEPEPEDPARLGGPVDAAVRVRTSAITLPQREAVNILDKSSGRVRHVGETARSCPTGCYLLEISTQVKIYLEVEAAIQVSLTPESTIIDFGAPTEVIVGVRSFHRRPNGTITTTDNLDDVKAAVSLLGSSLKTTSPERSFPTLRGHPPRIELGEAWSRPDHLTAPETGVTIEVQRSLGDLLVAAPLAFYLGAELRWGGRRLLTEDGFVHSLEEGPGFEAGIERTLKQTFLLDCLTRTEGLHPVDLDERRTFESRMGGTLDFESLYDVPIGQRLEQYLEVPYRTLADLVPPWSAAAYVNPELDAVATLPYLLDMLSIIHTSGPQPIEQVEVPNHPEPLAEQGITRSVESAHQPDAADPHLVLPEADTAVTTTWVGDGIPLGAAKALAAGFEHRLEREPSTDDLRLQVVCNEPAMGEELDSVRDVYRARGDLPFDVEVRTGLSTDELAAALERETDFFHFIGHIDRQGFRCRDGWLDVETHPATVGCDVFLLNTCRSYEQGTALVRQGSIAGIVTLTDILNHDAAEIGRTLARFLHHGFPLYAALDVIRDTHRFGDAYTLLGDPHTVLSQPTTTFPEYLDLRSMTRETVSVTHRTFPTHRAGPGTEICPPHEDGDRYYLFGGEVATVELDPAELEEILAQPTPLRDEADLRFSVPPADDQAT